MTDRPLWDRAALPSGVAVAAATRVSGLVLAVVALVGLLGGWRWTVSVALGGAVVLAVLWGSARLLMGGARRWAPAVALLLALGLYLVAVVGLFVLALVARPAAGDDGWLRAPGVAAGILAVVLAWTTALLVVHVRHDRGPRRRRPPEGPVTSA